MILHLTKDLVEIWPDTVTDECYIENVLGLRDDGDEAIIIRSNSVITKDSFLIKIKKKVEEKPKPWQPSTMVEHLFKGAEGIPVRNTAEKLKLAEAVAEFAQAMYDRLNAKCNEGFTGWDNPQNRDGIFKRAVSFATGYCKPRSAVDAANMLMMVRRMDKKKEEESC
jgi:hypothetical protein